MCGAIVGCALLWHFRVFSPPAKYSKIVITDHFDKTLFVRGQTHQVEFSVDFSSGVGLVLPHHAVAAPILSGAWNMLAQAHPHCVLLIGPNHLEIGKNPFMTATREWVTPFGVVSPVVPAEPLPESVAEDVQGVVRDQSFAVQMPYLKTYLPAASVAPILVSRKATISDLETLAGYLAADKQLKTCIAVASVDFSHDTPERERSGMDQRTISLVSSGQYDALLALNGTRVDSPGSLVLLDMYIRKRFLKVQTDILYRSSSVLMLGEPPEYPAVGYVAYGYFL